MKRFRLILLTTAAALLIAACGNKDRNRVSDSAALGEYSAGENQDSLAPTVTAFPPTGSYGEEQKVQLWADKGPVTIYYTTNGDKPTINSDEYAAGTYIDIDRDMVVRYFAIDNVGNTSAIAGSEYEIILNAPNVNYQPLEGGYTDPITLQFFPDNGIIVFFTLDQSDPKTSSTATQYRASDEACNIADDPNCPADGFYSASNIYITKTTLVKYVTQKPNGEFSAVEELEYFVSDGDAVGTTGSVNLTYLVLNGDAVEVELDKIGLGSLPDKVRQSLKIMEMDLIEEGLLENTFDAIKCGPDATPDGGGGFTNCGAYDDGTPERNLQKLLTMNAVTADLTGASMESMIDATNLLGLEGGAIGFMQKLMKTSSENEAFLPTSVLQTAAVNNLIMPHPEATREGSLPIYLEDGLTEMESLSERMSQSDQNADGIDDGTGKKIIFTFKDFVDNTLPSTDPGYDTPDGLDDRTHCPTDADGGDYENGDVLTDDPANYDFLTKCVAYPGGATAGHPGQTDPFQYLPFFGFIDPTKTTSAEVMTEEFTMKITAELSGVAQKGFDFAGKVIGNAFEFDPAGVSFPVTDPEDFEISGLVPGNLTMDMGFRMVEFPAAFPEFGARRADFDDDLSGWENGQGTSGIWDIDTYYLEYVVMDAAYTYLRSIYMDDTGSSDDDPVHQLYCGGGTSVPSCFRVAEIWVGYDTAWNTTAVPDFLDLPGAATQAQMLTYLAPGPYLYMESVMDPPQMGFYLHDLLSYVANQRMHDSPSGTIPEGEANVSLQFEGIEIDIDDVEVEARVKDQMLADAGLQALQDTTAALFSSDDTNIPDVYIAKNIEDPASPPDRVIDSSCVYNDTAYEADYPYALVFKTENLNDWLCNNIPAEGTSCTADMPAGKLYNNSKLVFYKDFNLSITSECSDVIFIPSDSESSFYTEPHNIFYVEVADGERYRLKINHTSINDKVNFDWIRMQ